MYKGKHLNLNFKNAICNSSKTNATLRSQATEEAKPLWAENRTTPTKDMERISGNGDAHRSVCRKMSILPALPRLAGATSVKSQLVCSVGDKRNTRSTEEGEGAAGPTVVPKNK